MFAEALRVKVKKIKQSLRGSYSKSSKIAITAHKFSKISGGACPQTPLEIFLFLNQLQISSAEKIRLKKYMEIMVPSFKNFSLRHESSLYSR